MSNFSSRWLDYAPVKETVEEKRPETHKNTASKTDKNSVSAMTPNLEVAQSIEMVPRLPWQLERLISAACADVLPQGMVNLTAGIVPDLNRYVLAWGCSYLTGDRTEAERRLWEAHRAWQGVN